MTDIDEPAPPAKPRFATALAFLSLATIGMGLWLGWTSAIVLPRVDPSRAPPGKHTGYAYCHVPAGSPRDVTDLIEAQLERFAPGFRERVLARHVTDAAALERYNANYVGGAITGGAATLGQLFFRPVARCDPYRTPHRQIYLCSSSTPPGGGVHGMCGYFAARSALKRLASLVAGAPRAGRRARHPPPLFSSHSSNGR